MINSTSLKFTFGFLVMVASSLLLVTMAAYYEESTSVKEGVAANCVGGEKC